jgi:PAS domain S-box-containing protein
MGAKLIQFGACGFLCHPALTKRGAARIVKSLTAGLCSAVPVLAIGGNHASDRSGLILANDALLELAGASSLEGAARFLCSELGGCLEHLAEAAAQIEASIPATLEFPFDTEGARKRATFYCYRLPGSDPPLLAAAILDIQACCHGRGKPAGAKAAPRGEVLAAKQKSQAQTRAGAAPGAGLAAAELRRLKAELRELSGILEIASDGVAVLDVEGRILKLNRSGEALLGVDQHEAAGKPFTSLLAPESRRLAQDYFDGLKLTPAQMLLNEGREVLCLAQRGGTIPVFLTLGRIGLPDGGRGAPPRFCALMRDLTHWKKIERELNEARRLAERASALKSDFLARVSHEIRTPLNAILGFAEVMANECFGPVGNKRYKGYIRDIYASGSLVVSLADDLLDLAKIESGKMEFEFASIDANHVLSGCVSIMKPQARRERVVIKLCLSPALPNVLADERALRQILLNLLSNAVKFNRPGGCVTASTAFADSGSVVIRIRDTGIGMPEESIGEALEPFRRLAAAQPSVGTGLGLPLTKALAEANHASLTLRSKEHEGTLAEVVFPPSRILAE